MAKHICKYLLGAALLASASSARAQDTAPNSKVAGGGSVGPGVPAFTVRAGYRVTLASNDNGNTRFIEFDGTGKTLFVSQNNRNKILALTDKDGDGLFETSADFVTDQKSAHGMCWKDGWLWFAPEGKISKARDADGDGKAEEIVTVLEGLDKGGGHWQRSILVGEDGFYTSIGDPNNFSIPEESGADRQKIWKYTLDGKARTLFASGLRNTEKLRFQPGTNEIYGADHGSDNIGGPLGEKDGQRPITDNLPPCEFNHYVSGAFYGHPYITATGMPRFEYRERPDLLELAAKTTRPAWSLGAHWAPNGWAFTTKSTLGAPGAAYIAAHGSWNSSTKVGYRVERVMFDNVTHEAIGAQGMISTLSPDGRNVLGRPVDCVEAPDGTLLWSDDQNNRVYRLSPEKRANPNTTVRAAQATHFSLGSSF